MTTSSRQSVYYKIAVLLIAVASCVRVVVCFVHNPMDYVWSDMARHWSNGVHFPGGGYFGAGDPIGYQVYILILHKVTFDQKFLIALASALLSILMPWTFYRAARNFGLPKTPSLWVWALIAATPSLLAIYHYIMMETLLLFLEGLALWMTARYLRRGGRLAFLVMVVTWTLASLTKPTVVPVACICVLWGWWKQSTPLKDLAIGAVLAFVMLLPQAVRTKAELGFAAPFGNPWLTKIMLRDGAQVTHLDFYAHRIKELGRDSPASDYDEEFSSPSCYVRPLSPLSSWTMRRAQTPSRESVIIDAEHGERDWRAAYELFNHDPDEWMAQWRENVVLFFFAPSWPESAVNDWEGRLDYDTRWVWAPLILVVLVGNIRQFIGRRFDLIPIAVTAITLSMVLQNVVLFEGRYRKPIEPLLWLNLVWIVSAKKLGAGGKDGEQLPARIPAQEAAV